MSITGAVRADLAEFRVRLEGGVCPAARRGRPGDWQFRDDEALPAAWPGDIFAALSTMRDDPWQESAAPRATIDALAAQLRGRRALLLTVLFSPARILDRLQKTCDMSSEGVIDSWIAMFWTAEAAFRAITDSSLAGPGGMASDAALLRPMAARTRFLVSSEPMRWRAQQDVGWWAQQGLQFGGSGILGRALGDRSWGLVVGRCQEARRDWVGCLGAYQAHPLLSQVKSPELEQELRALVFRHPDSGIRHPGGRKPLGLSVRPLTEAPPLTAEDAAVIDEVTDRHLLPRFDLGSVAALSVFDDSRGLRWARLLLGIAVVLAGMAAGICAGLLLVYQATWIAVGCYLLIAVGVLRFGTRWAAPWLLRLPAASAVGVIALVTFLPAGWLRTPFDGWAAVAVLAVSACGYLAVELRSHGAEGWALLRSLGVAVIGAVHALMVSLLGLVAVAPAFVSNSRPHGSSLAALWHRPGYGHAGMVLLLSTAWCLAVGVFSQILWDDRPITSPLAHLSWRSAR